MLGTDLAELRCAMHLTASKDVRPFAPRGAGANHRAELRLWIDQTRDQM